MRREQRCRARIRFDRTDRAVDWRFQASPSIDREALERISESQAAREEIDSSVLLSLNLARNAIPTMWRTASSTHESLVAVRMSRSFLAPVLACATLAVALVLAYLPSAAQSLEDLTIVTGGGRHVFHVEVARTDDDRAKGLMD